MSFPTDFGETLKARIPLVYIQTSEEVRVIGDIREAAASQRVPRPVWTWTAATGLTDGDGKVVANTTDPVQALQHAAVSAEAGVFVFCDLHAYFGSENRPGDPVAIRTVRETALDFRHGDSSRMLVVTAPVRVIPAELDALTTLVDYPLPGADDIRGLLDAMIRNNTGPDGHITADVDPATRERLVHAALGLTMSEAEDAFARAMVNDGRLGATDVATVLEEKRQAVRKSGLLEFVAGDLDLDDVGGLENLKRWLRRRDGSWLDKAVAFGLPSPRGVLITGVPGCGKSLTAKATATSFGLPLLRLDIGRIFSGLVGSSEQNVRTAIATAEATAPCVLWVDEIEKGFSNTTGSGDSGTSARVFATFLTWLQEKTAPVFVVATANNIDALPPEFLRKGRFDEIFFVDLPTARERDAIWRLHLAAAVRDANGLASLAGDDVRARLVAHSENYSGAEIAQAVTAALYAAYSDRRQVTEDDLTTAVSAMIPLSVTQAEAVQRIRDWAAQRAVRATGAEDLAAGEVGPEASPTPAVPLRPGRGGRTVDF